jgi:hypothetical protein
MCHLFLSTISCRYSFSSGLPPTLLATAGVTADDQKSPESGKVITQCIPFLFKEMGVDEIGLIRSGANNAVKK